jgi:hypothetical protein
MATSEQSETQGDAQQPASIDQMLNAAYKLNDWLNFYWNFYVVFVGVVFGWIFSAQHPWQFIQKLVISVFFIGFAAVSIVALFRTYDALDKTARSLGERWGHDPFKDAILAKVSQRRWRVEILMHLVADVTVVCCIWIFTPQTEKGVGANNPPNQQLQRTLAASAGGDNLDTIHRESWRAWITKEWKRLLDRRWNVFLTLIALGFAGVSLFYVPSHWKGDDATKAVFLGIWTIGIPVFFFLQWYFTPQPDEKGADVGQKVWLAIASFLTLIYFGDHLKNPAQERVRALEVDVQRLKARIQ